MEQAGFLEEEKIPIGIVNGAAMPTRWAIDIIGEQAHSGATPMELYGDGWRLNCQRRGPRD